MLEHLLNVISLADVAVQHAANQIDALLAHDERDAQVAVHDLVDAVKGILLVDDGVEEDAQRPNVLLFTPVRLAS